MNPNAFDDLITALKPGYKTSELWVAVAAAVAQAVIVGFDPSKPLSSQMSNLTWLALVYIGGRSAVKSARVVGQAKAASAAAAAAAPAAAPTSKNGSTPEISPETLARLDLLILLRDRGILSSSEYEAAKQQVAGA